MKIAFVPHGYPPSVGGAQNLTRGLALALAGRGHEVQVIAPAAADPEHFYTPGSPLLPPGDTGDGPVRVSWIPVGVRRLLPFGGHPADRHHRAVRNRYRRGLRRALERIRPEVVVTLPHLFPNVEEVLTLRPGADWRLVFAPHLHEEDPHWQVERVTAAVTAADAVMALTTHERDRLVAAYGADPARVGIVTPAVAAQPIAPEATPDPVVLFLGRRSASKRVEVLLEAMELVRVHVPGARLVVAGPPGTGDPTADGTPDHVTTVDTITPAERDTLIASARVVATASVIESFGITTLEAWALGRPVVVADTPVARSLVRHEVDGLVAGRDPAGMAEAIVRLLTDPTEAARFGEAGRRRTLTEFTWNRSADALLALIATTEEG